MISKIEDFDMSAPIQHPDDLGRFKPGANARPPAQKEVAPTVARAAPFVPLALADSKQRKMMPVISGVIDYFPDAIAAVAYVSYLGNQKHNPGQDLHWARGKSDDHIGTPVRVNLAGGELVIPPEHVLETVRRITGKGYTLSQAHEILDKWVLHERTNLRKTLAKLPGPVKD